MTRENDEIYKILCNIATTVITLRPLIGPRNADITIERLERIAALLGISKPIH